MAPAALDTQQPFPKVSIDAASDHSPIVETKAEKVSA